MLGEAACVFHCIMISPALCTGDNQIVIASHFSLAIPILLRSILRGHWHWLQIMVALCLCLLWAKVKDYDHITLLIKGKSLKYHHLCKLEQGKCKLQGYYNFVK